MARYSSIALFLLATAPVEAASVSGVGRAIDGDSLMVGQTEVRLFGIDAPELHQTCMREGKPWPCGSVAADRLSQLVAGKLVSCLSLGEDRHGRTLARCSVGATDLNRTMVATGMALAYRRYSMDYVSAEDSAKLTKRGIWTGSFELPSEVRLGDDDRRAQTQAVEQSERPVVSSLRPSSQPAGNCRIKGNHSRRGEKIYHLPGRPYYAETVAEQMFCTEADARAAGYRRSRAQ